MGAGEVDVVMKVAVVTVVGRKIREKLQELGKAMEAFAEVEERPKPETPNTKIPKPFDPKPFNP